MGKNTLSTDQQLLHVANRLGFGPRAGDIERIRSQGIHSYMQEQLHPESIPNDVVEKKLARFQTLSMSSRELAELYFSARRELQRYTRKQSEGGSNESMEGSGDREMMEPPEADLRQEDARRRARMRMRQIPSELIEAKILRAVFSERQLQEVLVDFWMNHFNIFMPKGLDRILTTRFEQTVIRPRVFGRFEDLLMATARSPAMLFYLDNWVSSAPAEVMSERMKTLGQRRRYRSRQARSGDRQQRFLQRARGLNENYARELLELHTLGVDGGYAQQDVIEVARCLTGWTITHPRRGGSFRFEPLLHEGGEKFVLGHRIRSEGVEEGERVIEILARHPSTARFISRKLARRFVADDPPTRLVEAATKTFQRTGGDLREVLRSIFTHPLFLDPGMFQAKTKKPFELVVSSLRAVSADVASGTALSRLMADMGEALYQCPEPTGYPDTAPAWINTNSLLTRLNFALALAANRIPGVEIDRQAALSLFDSAGFSEPDEQLIKDTASRLGGLGGRPSHPIVRTALILGSPEFQKR